MSDAGSFLGGMFPQQFPTDKSRLKQRQ